jgi:hypothetical protein
LPRNLLPSTRVPTAGLPLPSQLLNRIPVTLGKGAIHSQIVRSAAGVLTVRRIEQPRRPPEFVPAAFVTRDKAGALDVQGPMPQVRLRTSRGLMLLQQNGFRVRGQQFDERTQSYDRRGIERLVDILIQDQRARESLQTLRPAVASSSYEYTALHGHSPSARYMRMLRDGNGRMSSFGKGRTTCSVEEVVDVVEREIVTWVEIVSTAADQFAQCLDECPQDSITGLPHWDCALECTWKGFEDVFLGTQRVVEVVTEEVTRYETHCLWKPGKRVTFPTLDGPVVVGDITRGAAAGDAPVDLDAIRELIEPFEQFLNCLLKGEWDVTRLEDLRVDIEGIEEVPLAVTVCLDRECSDVIKAAMLSGGLSIVVDAFTRVGVQNMMALFKAPLVNSLLAALGLSAATLASALFGLLAVFAAHGVIIGGQIAMYDLFDAAPDGVCLHHPTLPVVVATAVNPILGILALGNLPVVVTPRGE